MAHITTHVLDLVRGIPAAGVAVTLHAIEGDHRRLVTSTTTNADGRTAVPLVESGAMAAGQYEITFFMAAYWRARGDVLSSPPFLDDIVIRVGVAEAHGRYHVPLLASPHGYSTYRGS
jgi:5-hydroxyisourate hydrolase